METTKLSPGMTQARRALLLDSPFFGQLLLNQQTIADPEAKPVWTNGKQIGYCAEQFDSLPLVVRTGLLAKLCLHVAFEHHLRRANRDKELWQKACDYVVNPVVLDSGLQLPSGAVQYVGEEYAGLSAEEVYEMLRRNMEQQQKQSGSPPNAGGGQPQAAGGPGAAQAKPGAIGQPPGAGQQQPPATQAAGGPANAPPSASGTAQQGTGAAQPAPAVAEVRDLPGAQGGGASAAEKQQASNDSKVAVEQALHNAKQQGFLPAGLERAMLEQLEPETDWKSALRQFMQQTSRDNMSWSRANRRYISRGLYLPAVHSERMGHIVVAVDTSGSIGQLQLAAFSGELNAIIEDTKPERITVIYCDAEVGHTDEFTAEDAPIELKPIGGGGTAFEPVFKFVEDNELLPICLVYLTDMYGSFPKEEPDYPVLWASTSHNIAAPFGEVIEIKEV